MGIAAVGWNHRFGLFMKIVGKRGVMKGSRKEGRHETQRTEEIQRMDDRVFSPAEQLDRIAAGGAMKREALDW